MFRPVKLTRVTIQTPEDHISKVMAILGDLRLLHLIRMEETHLGRMGHVAHANTALLDRYDALLVRINRLLEELQFSGPTPVISKIPQPDKVIFRLEEECTAVEKESLEVLEQRKKLRNTLSEHQTLIARLHLLEPAGVALDRLYGLRYTTFHAGLIPEENLERLETSLGEIHHSLIPIDRKEGRVVLVAMSLKEDETIMLRALKSAFWDPLEISADLQGSITGILERLTGEEQQIEDDLAGLESKCEALAHQFGGKLRQLREELLLAHQLLLAQEKFGQIDHTYLLTGWLPMSLFEDLRQRVMKACSDKALVERIDPEEVKEVRSGILTIPILFNHPALIRPFERLTTLYGTPTYEEVEPTGFLAVTFLLLFGMMFGDVGHGAVLCALGYLVFKKMFRYLDYGIILMECGVSAMMFGVLYGSIFGMEDLIPALWMHPLDNITYFMKVSAILGISIISTGLVLNLINVVRQHRYAELLSASGLAGALFYWLIAALGVRYFITGPLSAYEMAFAQVTGGLLFTLMVFQRPIRLLLARRSRAEKGRLLPSGLGVTFLESLIEVLDELLRYLANTVSFVRVAAFGLAHAGLFIAVFTLADMVRSAQGGGLFYWMTLVLGNIVIIGLEGLVVSIQTIRLEYYEFFSKFFRGGGKPFQPLFEEKELQG
ncbi:MAG: hypothetical protein GQ559_12380 [Desulfobulbaceae bacterium]|nr:hypothetical protein [Desulfobulbaceae bacterium]